MKPDIKITEEQYQKLRHEEDHGTICLQFEIIEDVVPMSDFCYKEDGQWFIAQGAYEFSERNGFVW